MVYAAGRSWASRRYGGDGDLTCNNDYGIAMHWRLLFVALVIAAIAAISWNQASDYQLGMLCGMSVGLAAWGLILAILRLRKRQRGDNEAL